MKISRPVILAVVIVVVLAGSGTYYYTNVLGGNCSNCVTVNMLGSTPGLYGQNATQHPDAFDPLNFTVIQGQHVTLVFDNTDDGPHELVIPAYNVTTGIVQGGQTVRVNFVADKAGIFPFFQPQGVCNAGGLSPQQGGCTGDQITNGNMTVLAH
jgi:cupredoxin-like protein